MRRFFKTALFRLSLWHTLIFTISAIAVLGLIAVILHFVQMAEYRSELEEKAERLTTLAKQEGLEAVAALITKVTPTHKPGIDREGYSWRLQAADGTRLAGDLPNPAPAPGYHWLSPPDIDDDEPFYALVTPLPDGATLLIAHDGFDLHDLHELFTEQIPFAFALLLPFAAIGGALMSAHTLKRMETISDTAAAIRRGGLSRRIPVGERDDEFDHLAGNLNHMLDHIEELTEGIRQVTNSVAHDMRTPLTQLRANLERSLTRPRDAAQDAEAMGHAIERCDTILETFDALLRLAEIESGAQRAGFAPINLSALLDDLAETYAAVAEDAGYSLTTKIEPDLHLFGDAALLSQMCANLIENALQHTPEGTEITLSLTRHNGTASLRIADNGPGVPGHDCAPIFQRFHRGDTSRSGKGTGLGLSIVAAIARLHQITLDCRSDDTGLTVTATFHRHIG